MCLDARPSCHPGAQLLGGPREVAVILLPPWPRTSLPASEPPKVIMKSFF